MSTWTSTTSIDSLTIELRVLAGSGDPLQWSFRIAHLGGVVAQMSGPRLLVLETLARWVTLFEQESRPGNCG